MNCKTRNAALSCAIVLAASISIGGADRIQGLREMAARTGWRSMEHVRRGDTFLSERTVIRDSRTGAIAWRMTSDPAVDANDYYDLPSWNADGSVMSFLTARGGRKVYWLMDADGSHLRPMPAPAKSESSSREGPVRGGYWSVRYRDRFYQAIEGDQDTAITAINPFTGEHRVIVRVNRKMGDMQPPHPTDEWFLFGSRPNKGGVAEPSKAWVVGLDGSVQEVQFERRWHRLRFTKSPDRRIFFNFDEPRTQWTVLPDGSGRTSIPYPGGHPDFLPDGSELFYFAPDGNKIQVWGIRYDGTGRRTIAPFSGHGGPALDGDWFVADGRLIAVFRTDGSQTSRILFYHESSTYSHIDTQWHPDHHTSHAHACFSPDGTKVIFNSDFLGQYSDVYVAINRFPDPPRNLQVKNSGALLKWSAPKRGREIRGYHVYRSAESGVRYERLTSDAVRGTEWSIPPQSRAGYFVVTAVEHSGLESRASGEVYAASGEWKGPARVTIEAESGTTKLPMEEAMDQQGAANGLYIASPAGKAGGTLSIDIAAPKEGTYRLWARVKGQGALDAGPWGAIDCAAAQWTWKEAKNAVPLRSGAVSLKIQAVRGAEAIDKFLLTDDNAFVPAGRLVLDEQAPPVPAGLKATGLSPNTLHLQWTKSSAADLDHYNVYSSLKPQFACERASLLASPSEAEFVDWGLPLNSTRWYRVTAVDRAGNESQPSTALRGDTPKFEPARISLKPADARLNAAFVESSKAAGGSVLRPTEGGNSGATWEFVVPHPGEYAIWIRAAHEKGKASSFDLTIDDQPSIPWRAWGRWGQWLSSAAGNKATGTPQLFRIPAGRHTLQAAAKSKTANAAEIVITDDPSWWPVTGMSTPSRASQPAQEE